MFCCILGCLLFLICIEFLYLYFPVLFCLSVISQVIGCEDRLRNDLYCVEWGVKLYSIQPCIINECTRCYAVHQRCSNSVPQGLSVRLSVSSFGCRTSLRRVCCCGPGKQEMSIYSVGRRAPSSSTALSCTALSSKCEQCHVVSCRRKRNTDLFLMALMDSAAEYSNAQRMCELPFKLINSRVLEGLDRRPDMHRFR